MYTDHTDEMFANIYAMASLARLNPAFDVYRVTEAWPIPCELRSMRGFNFST